MAAASARRPPAHAAADAARSVRAAPPPQQQAQYLHQFVLHAALDAVDEAMWLTKELHLKVGGVFKPTARM